MKVKILEVLEREQPYKPEGKTYTIYQYIVKALVDGKETPMAHIKTFSSTIAGQLDGKQFDAEHEAELDKYAAEKGKTVYTLKSGGAQGQQGFQGGKKSGWQPPVSYALEEYDSLFRHAYALSKKAIGDAEMTNYERGDLISRLVSTYVISATQHSVKVEGKAKLEFEAGPHPEYPASQWCKLLSDGKSVNELDAIKMSINMSAYNEKDTTAIMGMYHARKEFLQKPKPTEGSRMDNDEVPF